MKASALFSGLIFALVSTTATAGVWQSLGRVNGLIAMPNTQGCKHRIVNNYWSSKPAYYPTSVNTYSASNIEFVFNVDLAALQTLTSNSPTYSVFKSALTAYSTTATAKSLSGSVSVGQFPGVAIKLSYADANGLIQGRGWGVSPLELSFYELQELC
jgi:hypothetical protein